jgi:hypothetical protein
MFFMRVQNAHSLVHDKNPHNTRREQPAQQPPPHDPCKDLAKLFCLPVLVPQLVVYRGVVHQ